MRPALDVYRLLRPLLFALPPEAAHRLALAVLRRPWALPRPPAGAARPATVLGITFPNRLGVAAGCDKDGVAVIGLAKLGFGFVEVGTVTPRPQPGNPKPRLFRLPADAALINRMGFNSAGAAAATANLRAARRSGAPLVPIGVNIGKNRATSVAAAADDYLRCLEAVHDVADFVVVNVSSPNTPGLTDLQAAGSVRRLVAGLVATRDRLATGSGATPAGPPLLVKLSPDLPRRALERAAGAALDAGAGGIVAVNTTASRPPTLRSRHAGQAGGLSGRPLFALAEQRARLLRAVLGDGPLLVGVGGVAAPADFRALRDAGADLVQIYTSLVYHGPAIVARLAAA